MLAAGAVALVLLAGASPSLASGTRIVSYRGLTMTVPASWPVYDLAGDPARCVRFDQHAVYLGAPSAVQDCPARAVGRTEAILLEPLTAAAVAVSGSASEYDLPAAGVRVTATWLHDRAAIERAFASAGISTAATASAPDAPATASAPAAAPAAASAPGAATLAPGAPITATGAVTASATPASVLWTGMGFDACSAPSTSQMAAWRADSPYRAIGIYIGGANRACSQPNLTSTWVKTVVAAGWHLIPLYVGLQAPNNACGCASIVPSSAAAEGTAAANDAVSEARSLGLGTPIYDDMEGYATGTPNTPAVLAFLQAWTKQLHSLGYISGVYTSAASGVSDLVAQYGTSYAEPNDLWFAEWNGVATTTCSCIPTGDWSRHQRVKQYASPGNQTYGGATISIDQDYVDAGVFGNRPPSCQSVSASTTVDQAVSVQLNCQDPAGATVTYSIARRPADGTLGAINQSSGSVRYTPDEGYTGSDSFTYKATSVDGTSRAATVTLTIS